MDKMSTNKERTLKQAKKIIEQMKRSKKKLLTTSQQKTLLQATQLYGKPEYQAEAEGIAEQGGVRPAIQEGTELSQVEDIGTPSTVAATLAAESEEKRRYVERLTGAQRLQMEREGLAVARRRVARRRVPPSEAEAVGVSGADRSYPVDTPGYRRVVLAQTFREGLTPLQSAVAFTRYREKKVPVDRAPDEFGATRIEEAKVGKWQAFKGWVKEKAGFVRGGRFAEVAAAEEYGMQNFPIVYPAAKFLIVGVVAGAGIGAGASLMAKAAPYATQYVPRAYYLIKPLVRPAVSAAAGFGTAVSGEQQYERLREEAGYPVWKSVIGAVTITGAGVAGGIGGFRATYRPVKVTRVAPRKTRIEYTRELRESRAREGVSKENLVEVLAGERAGRTGGLQFRTRFQAASDIKKSGAVYQKSIEDVLVYRVEKITTKAGKVKYKVSFVARERRFGEALGTSGMGSRAGGIERVKKLGRPRSKIVASREEAAEYVRSILKPAGAEPKGRVGRVQIYTEQDISRTARIGEKDVYVYTARQLRFEGGKPPKKALGFGVQAESDVLFVERPEQYVTRFKGKAVSYQIRAERFPESKQPGVGGVDAGIAKPGFGKQGFAPASAAQKKPGARPSVFAPGGDGVSEFDAQLWPDLARAAKRDPGVKLLFYDGQEQAARFVPPDFVRRGISPVVIVQKAKQALTPVVSVLPAREMVIQAQVSELGERVVLDSGVESVQSQELKLDQLQAQVQVQEQLQAQVQVQAQVQEQQLVQKQSLITAKDIIPVLTEVPPPPPVIELPDFDPVDDDGLFAVEVRREGLFRRVGVAVSAREAVMFGRRVVKGTAAASFRVQAIDEQDDDVLSAFEEVLGSDKEFYASVREPGVFIQKREFRIGSAGEKREITLKGIEAQRKKSRLIRL